VFSTAERIEEAVASWGFWAPVGFILVQIVQVIIFVIPGEIPQIAGGYLFGLFAGSLYSVVGILVGSRVIMTHGCEFECWPVGGTRFQNSA